MSAPASARMASATRLPRFVSDARRRTARPSSGTRLLPTTTSSSAPIRDTYASTTAAVRGSSAIAPVIGISS